MSALPPAVPKANFHRGKYIYVQLSFETEYNQPGRGRGLFFQIVTISVFLLK